MGGWVTMSLLGSFSGLREDKKGTPPSVEDLISRINAALVWDQSGPTAVFLYGKARSACFGSCYHSSFMTHRVILSSSPVKEACNSFCTGSRGAGTRSGGSGGTTPDVGSRGGRLPSEETPTTGPFSTGQNHGVEGL